MHKHDHDHDHAQAGLYAEDGVIPAVYSETRRSSFAPATTGAALAGRLADVIDDVAAFIQERGGFIGHIKLHARDLAVDSEAALWLSSTGRNVSCRACGGWNEREVSEAEIGFTAIALAVEETELASFAHRFVFGDADAEAHS
ncbi:MAG: hypothetical protein LBR00_05245 [Clostridiales Family XIII bacterium]|jgi:hypothetical protein|nr:hypothetical protein [Clostridiales Family XIII bacterium]